MWPRPASQSVSPAQPLLLNLQPEPGWRILSVEYFVSQSSSQSQGPPCRGGSPGPTTIRVIVWRS